MEWLALIGSLVGFVIWLVKRHLTKKADPMEQHRERYDKIAHEKPKINDALSGDLDELERLERLRDKNRKQ